MTKKERVREIILQLKQIKEERDLTSSEIYDMVLAGGYDLSHATVKRVFAPGSENQGFRYKDTIQPIARVLIGVNEEDEPLSAAEADALKNIALLKDAVINEIQKENEELKAKVERLSKAQAAYIAEIEFLKEQIDRKDDYIDRLAKKAGI